MADHGKKKWELEAEERKKHAEQLKAEEDRKKHEAIEKLKQERSVRGEDIPDAVSHATGGGGVVTESQVPSLYDEATRQESLEQESKRLERNIGKGVVVNETELERQRREAEEKRQREAAMQAKVEERLRRHEEEKRQREAAEAAAKAGQLTPEEIEKRKVAAEKIALFMSK